MIHRRSALQNSADGLTIGSMGFTAYFGWTAGGDMLWACLLGAFVGALMSFCSPLLWKETGVKQHQGRPQVAAILGIFAAMFLIVDAVTNVGAVFAMRQSEIVGSQHQTSLAGDARNEVQRLESRIAEIREQTAWKTTYLAPEAYDSLIEAAELVRANEEKRGGCGPLCEQKTKEKAELEANRANAMHRQALKAEMVTLESELVDAKAQVHDTPPKVSAVWTQVEKLAAMATLDIDPSQTTKETAYLLITGFFGLATSIGAAILSWAIGCNGSPTAHSQTSTVSQSPYLENHTTTPNQFVPASSYKTSNTIIVPGGKLTGTSIDELDDVRRRCMAFIAKHEAAA